MAKKASQIAWERANPEKVKAGKARYRERHREKLRAYGRERYAKKRDQIRKQQMEYYHSNLERAREVSANATRRRREVYKDDLANEYAAILRGDPCSYCGEPMEHIDHIEPIRDGGDGSWDNLTAACQPCNASKGARSLLHFLRGD